MTLDFLNNRRSARAYEKDYEIPKEILDDIVNTTLKSPTGADCKEIDMICVTNKELIAKINQAAFDSVTNEKIKQMVLASKQMTGNDQPITYDASAVVFFVINKEKNTHPEMAQIDAGIACGMLLSAVAAYNLQSVVLGFLVNPNVEEVLGLEKGSIAASVAIGKTRGLPLKEKVITNTAKFVE